MSDDETLQRLRREREEADARYDRALTAADKALPGVAPQPPLDEDALRQWKTVAADPLVSLSGWRRRLAGFVWRLVGPMLQQQQEFNHAVVYHLARPQVDFNQTLVRCLQQITLLVESKDREAVATLQHALVALQHDLAGGLSSLADAIAKRWESMQARDQRYEARLSELADIRAAIASLHQVSHALKREVQRVLEASAVGAPPSASRLPPAASPLPPSASRLPPDIDAYKYVGFEDQFRGSAADIRARLGDYLSCFEGAADVLDVGCGRGEFLQLLGERGVKARGIDINHEMVETCRSRGLDVAEGDALDYLASLPDASLGGLFAAQVVEHLEPAHLIQLLDVAFEKLRPGARVVLETINPACWAAFFDSYIRDLTHVRPIHPETLKYLLQASGFQAVEIRYRAPYPESARLQQIAIPEAMRSPTGDWAMLEVVETFNANVEKLNSKLFTHLDYAALATRV